MVDFVISDSHFRNKLLAYFYEVDPGAFPILLGLICLSEDGKKVRTSAKELAVQTGFGISKVKRALEALLKEKWIKRRKSKKGITTTYIFTFDAKKVL